MKRFRPLLAPLLAIVVLVGFLANDREGHVGGVRVDANGVRLAIDLQGRVESAGAYGVDVRRRVVVSPDGRWRAVLQLPGSVGNTGTVAIGRNEAGAPLRIVERHLYAGTGSVAWASSSDWLAMTVWTPGLLSAVAVSTAGRRRVLAAPFCGDFESGLAWHPHGNLIALGVPAAGEGCSKRVDLRVRQVEGRRGRVIARDIVGGPTWSPDGDWIAVSGGDAEVMRADGTLRRRLNGAYASWSTQASVLALMDDQSQLLSVGPARGPLVEWDSNVDPGSRPTFSPNGRLIAYRRWDAIVVRRVADRRVVVRVPTTGNVQLANLAWATDGRSLVVEARIHSD